MSLNIKKHEGIIEIFLKGRLDVQLSAEIEKEIQEIIEEDPGNHILLNLKDISYLSSSGIRIFVSLMRILKLKEKKLLLCRLDNNAKKIFEIVELIDIFEIYDNSIDAINSLKE